MMPVGSLLAACCAVWLTAACARTHDFAPPPPAGEGAAALRCQRDEDCVPAGRTCCECPSFAVHAADPIRRACAAVDCSGREEPPACSEVAARCGEGGACELACAPVACELLCSEGFARDASACLTCACASPALDGCAADADCARTRADCCGCSRGGFDTAVLAREREDFDRGLECPDEPSCPEVTTCRDEAPACVQGRCELVAPGLPAGACGRADLPACPAGEVCTLNASREADLRGIGQCRPLPPPEE
jgi:hypothetical protein